MPTSFKRTHVIVRTGLGVILLPEGRVFFEVSFEYARVHAILKNTNVLVLEVLESVQEDFIMNSRWGKFQGHLVEIPFSLLHFLLSTDLQHRCARLGEREDGVCYVADILQQPAVERNDHTVYRKSLVHANDGEFFVNELAFHYCLKLPV